VEHLHLKIAPIISTNFEQGIVRTNFALCMFIFIIVKKKLQTTVRVQIFYNFRHRPLKPTGEAYYYPIYICNAIFGFFIKFSFQNKKTKNNENKKKKKKTLPKSLTPSCAKTSLLV
jgi:hypothetical protein